MRAQTKAQRANAKETRTASEKSLRQSEKILIAQTRPWLEIDADAKLTPANGLTLTIHAPELWLYPGY